MGKGILRLERVESRPSSMRTCWKPWTIAAALLTVQMSQVCAAQAALPEPLQQAYARVRRALDVRDWTLAERELNALPVSEATTAEAHRLKGYTLFHESRAVESLAEYTAAAALGPLAADDLLLVCSDYILLKDYADAEHWLQYTTQHFPLNGKAWYLLGRTQSKLDHAADAVLSYRRSLQLNPTDEPSQYNLGLALEALGKPAEAEAAYRTAIAWEGKSGSKDPQAYLDLGTLLAAQQRNQEALALLQQAALRSPSNATVQQQLGVVLAALDRDGEAVAAFQRAISLAPQAGQPHYLLGRLYRRMGRSEEAQQQFTEVQRLYGAHSNQETPNTPSEATQH